MIPLYAFGVIEVEPRIGGALRTFRLIQLFRLLGLLLVINLFRTAKYLKASVCLFPYKLIIRIFWNIGSREKIRGYKNIDDQNIIKSAVRFDANILVLKLYSRITA